MLQRPAADSLSEPPIPASPKNRPDDASPRLQREAQLSALGAEQFDLLVVGGGITGCGVARDAALRGLRVALVEKDDFASGTSSRSSRLIHGGLRYLEHGHLHLVFEASAERHRLLRLAPHLVRPLEFVWPVYAGARVPRWKLAAGLTLYDALALFRNVGTHRRLSTRDVMAREPHLLREGLLGGARYFDAATDDARLTLANALGAAEAGAVVANHVALQELTISGNGATGATVVDVLGGRSIEVRARVIVNATGPWSDELRGRRTPPSSLPASGRESRPLRPTVRGSKGAHIAVPRERIGNRGALTLLSPLDGRVMFVLPLAGDEHTVIGTTDTYTTASPDDVRASEADVEYLLESANRFFPDARLARADVVSAWAGIRPLVPTGKTDLRNGDPTSVSREHAITRGDHGVVTITGGKLTTYRVMAAEVVDVVSGQLGKRRLRGSAVPTRELPLPGGDLAYIEAAIDAAERATGDEGLARYLVRAHGSRWSAVVDEMSDGGPAERLAPGLPYTIGELRYAVRCEMACTLADLLVRRTHLAFETKDHGLGIAPRVVAAVAPLLEWSAEDGRHAIEAYAHEVQRLFTIDAG